MTVTDVVELIRRYAVCPKCGCDTVNIGRRELIFDTATGYFYRGCRCGWSVEIKEGSGDG